MQYKGREKEYHKKYREKHYFKNKEEIKRKSRKYYHKNKNNPKFKLKRKEYREKSEMKARQKEYGKKYYQKNKEEKLKYSRKYYQKNKDNPEFKLKIKKYNKRYYQKNKEYYKEYNKKWEAEYPNYQKKYNKKWGKEHRKELNQKQKERYKTDKNFKIAYNLKTRFIKVLKKYTRTGKIMTSKKYGVDWKKVIEYLEKNKLIPKDYATSKNKYHIHHNKPLHTFNFVNKDGTTNLKEVSKAFSPENHKILTIEEHRKIHNHIRK